MNWLQKLLALLQLVPSILTTIVQVESVFQAAGVATGTGASKKDVVMAAVTSATDVAPEIVASVGNTADKIVGALNAGGVFKKA